MIKLVLSFLLVCCITIVYRQEEKFNKEVESFAEYFAQYEPSELRQHNIGAGFTYAIGKHIALYLAGGHTIFYTDYNYFISGGAALRL